MLYHLQRFANVTCMYTAELAVLHPRSTTAPRGTAATPSLIRHCLMGADRGVCHDSDPAYSSMHHTAYIQFQRSSAANDKDHNTVCQPKCVSLHRSKPDTGAPQAHGLESLVLFYLPSWAFDFDLALTMGLCNRTGRALDACRLSVWLQYTRLPGDWSYC